MRYIIASALSLALVASAKAQTNATPQTLTSSQSTTAAELKVNLSSAGTEQPTASSTFPQPQSLDDRKNKGTFVLQGAVDGDGAKQGASFSYTKQDKSDYFLSKFAAFYLTPAYYGQVGETSQEIYGLLGADGQLGTRSKSSDNFLNIRAQLSYIYSFGGLNSGGLPDPFHGGSLFMRVGPLYQATQDFKLQDLLFEAAATYSSPGTGIGAYRCFTTACGPDDAIELYWEPRVALQAGGVAHRDKSVTAVESGPTIVRLIPAISAGLSFPRLAKSLVLHSLTLSVDEALQYLPIYHRIENDVTTAFNVGFLPGISLNVSYETGAPVPTFKHDDIFLVALKVKIGVVPFFSQ